jgi:hypothetical protein
MTDILTNVEVPIEDTTEKKACATSEEGAKEKVESDEYAYIENKGFTSEIYKIEIRNLPKYYGINVCLFSTASIAFFFNLSICQSGIQETTQQQTEPIFK